MRTELCSPHYCLWGVRRMGDCFASLGLARIFRLDKADLERRYLDACRKAHPDFQHDAGTGFVQAAEVQLSILHAAYAVLADPYRRAEHLLELAGGPGAHEHRAVPDEFLEAMYDLRERMAGLKKPSDRLQFQHEIEAMIEKAESKLAQACENLAQPENKVQLREKLNQVAFLRGVVRDLDRTSG